MSAIAHTLRPAETGTISPAEALRLLACEAALVVDVREPEELAATGRLRIAVNAPLAGLETAQLLKTRTIVLYSASGRRSAVAAQRLRAMGYVSVHDLGAFDTAVAAGLGVVRPG